MKDKKKNHTRPEEERNVGEGIMNEECSFMTPNVNDNKDDDEDDDDDHMGVGSSHDSLGTSLNDGIKNKTGDAQEEEQIAKNETTAVNGLKILVLVVLVLAMVTVTVGVYMFTNNAEQKDFEDSLSDYTVKISASLGENIDLTLGAVDAFVVSIVSFAKATNQTWPFVTIPDFAVRGAKIRSLSSSTVLNLYQYVSQENRVAWEAYTAIHGPQWVNEAIAVQERDANYKGPIIWDYENWNVIHRNDAYETEFPSPSGTDAAGPYLPTWQAVPVVPRYPAYNWDLYGDANLDATNTVFNTKQVSITEAYLIHVEGNDEVNESNEIEADWLKDYIQPGEEAMEPVSDIFYPILSNAADDVTTNNTNSEVVSILSLVIYWRDMLKNILPTGANGIDVVFENPCSPTFTYRINGPSVEYRGSGDLHETAYNHLGTSAKLLDLQDHGIGSGRQYTGIPVSQEVCPFTIAVYPSAVMQDYYTTSNPMLFTVVAVIIFLFTSAVFVFYDIMVERRQKVVLSTAAKSSAIVSSLFPSNVRAELMREQEQKERERAALMESPKRRLKTFLMDDDEHTGRGSHHTGRSHTGHTGRGSAVALPYASKPLAELYADTTVFFGDIAGFTAWSSARDPTQVFTLLETLYGAFDAVARRRGVFKVETIGDSYVAVCGLPEPRKKHAVVMAKFATDCRNKTNQICQELEISLGPGTTDLKLRIGLHSGPVTAGVLRGDKSRFQLFGDTVNTAARMESNSIKNRIQVSQKTADLLVTARKGHWLTARDTLIDAKGKGKMQTYWLEPQVSTVYADSEDNTEVDMSTGDFDASEGNITSYNLHQKDQKDQMDTEGCMRLVEWNTAIFEQFVKQVVVHHRTASGGVVKKTLDNVVKKTIDNLDRMNPMATTSANANASTMVREEVVEILNLPEFDGKKAAATNSMDLEVFELDYNVKLQLHSFILAIASRYCQNPFHNFEHASHVTMATKKLLQQVITPDFTGESVHRKDLHDYTYGITSDPLIQLALATAALIHDIDHQGVSNGQLIKEESPVAIKYKNQSVAEQNSFDIAWDIMMDPCYIDLRNSICPSKEDLKRFRQIVLNAVMATDIFDKELKALRDSRWEKAFQQVSSSSLDKLQVDNEIICINRKATIVIEHIIQASDVSHCMQHWTVYQKWNRCLFREMYSAYLLDRGGENDPSQGWYKGELWFFDHYIIPLAHRLKECGVFGASYAELLDFARDNRMEWENKGLAIVAEMVEEFHQQVVEKPNKAKKAESRLPFAARRNYSESTISV